MEHSKFESYYRFFFEREVSAVFTNYLDAFWAYLSLPPKQRRKISSSLLARIAWKHSLGLGVMASLNDGVSGQSP